MSGNFRLSNGYGLRQASAVFALYWFHKNMNVERTMEFILQQQAKAEVQMAAMREQQARYEKQQAELQARHAEEHAKIDRQMKAIQKLITAGMKMIVKQGESMKGLARAQRDLADAQKVTEVKLQGLIDALRRGRNGGGSRH
jgi:hypothetical protein